MSILEGLFFGCQIPFDKVNMNFHEYYRAGGKADKCRKKILESYLDIEKLMEKYVGTLIEQTSLGAYRGFEISSRAVAVYA